jgi:hypothetical protein
MDERLRTGIRLFNKREFFACHEVLEAAWTAEAGRAACFYKPSSTWRSVSIIAGATIPQAQPVSSRRGFTNSRRICPAASASTRPGCTERHSLHASGLRQAHRFRHIRRSTSRFDPAPARHVRSLVIKRAYDEHQEERDGRIRESRKTLPLKEMVSHP